MMERGARYTAYAQLRESKLIIKNHEMQLLLQSRRRVLPTPPPAVKKQVVRCQAGSKGSSSSYVPNFSAALIRKENRKPTTKLPSPPQKGKNLRAAEKKGGRKTFASIQEHKLLYSAAANAVNAQNRCRRNKSALGYHRLF